MKEKAITDEKEVATTNNTYELQCGCSTSFLSFSTVHLPHCKAAPRVSTHDTTSGRTRSSPPLYSVCRLSSSISISRRPQMVSSNSRQVYNASSCNRSQGDAQSTSCLPTRRLPSTSLSVQTVRKKQARNYFQYAGR